MTDDTLTLDELPQPVEETTVHPDDLRVDGDNPNEQSDDMFGLLVDNLRDKGWIGNAIIANTGDLPGYDGDPEGLIADGEHRWRAAQEVGLDEVPVKLYDFEDDAQRRLWRQELNKISGEHDSTRDALEYDYLLNEGRSDDVQDLVDAITSTVFQTAVQELMDDDEYRKAVKTVADWNDWLGDRGHVEREPERLEANVSLEDQFMSNLKDYHGGDQDDDPVED